MLKEHPPKITIVSFLIRYNLLDYSGLHVKTPLATRGPLNITHRGPILHNLCPTHAGKELLINCMPYNKK